MVIFESEQELLDKLEQHDKFASDCALGSISFEEFCKIDDYFYFTYALDGHESDEEEKMLLKKHKKRIQLHQKIAEEVLNMVCSEENSKKTEYINAGRFGSKVAVQKIAKIIDENNA